MIAPEVIAEIERLLQHSGLSRRKIAFHLGVIRGTVNAVANGTRPRHRAPRRGRADDFAPPHGPPRRCRSCGRLVQMPCLACQLQEMLAKRNNTTHHSSPKP